MSKNAIDEIKKMKKELDLLKAKEMSIMTTIQQIVQFREHEFSPEQLEELTEMFSQTELYY